MKAAKLTLKFLQSQRNDTKLEEFYSKIVEMSKNITDEPTLPQCQKQPRRVEDGESNYRHDNHVTVVLNQIILPVSVAIKMSIV